MIERRPPTIRCHYSIELSAQISIALFVPTRCWRCDSGIEFNFCNFHHRNAAAVLVGPLLSDDPLCLSSRRSPLTASLRANPDRMESAFCAAGSRREAARRNRGARRSLDSTIAGSDVDNAVWEMRQRRQSEHQIRRFAFYSPLCTRFMYLITRISLAARSR